MTAAISTDEILRELVEQRRRDEDERRRQQAVAHLAKTKKDVAEIERSLERLRKDADAAGREVEAARAQLEAARAREAPLIAKLYEMQNRRSQLLAAHETYLVRHRPSAVVDGIRAINSLIDGPKHSDAANAAARWAAILETRAKIHDLAADPERWPQAAALVREWLEAIPAPTLAIAAAPAIAAPAPPAPPPPIRRRVI